MFERMKGMLALPEDPMQNAAARQGLLTAGAALLGGRGNLGEILGGGLLAGSQGYQGGLAQQQQQQYRQAQTQQVEMENKRLQAAADEPMQLQRILSGGQSTPMGPPASLPRLGGAPASGPSFGTAPAPGPIAPQAPADQYAKLMDYAQRLTEAGRVAQAKPYYDMAEKLRPKLMKQEARMVDGQRVMANVFEDGRTERVDGFAPDAEKLHFANTGGSTAALDPFTGKPVNTIGNTVSPDAQLSAATAQRGQNIARDSAAAADRRARDALGQGKTPVGYRWTADGKSLEAIPGGPVMAKTTEVQQKVSDAQSVIELLDVARPLIGKSTSSYGGAAVDHVARVFGASTEGSAAAAQLKALEGSLVSKMPKMSGPQSDKDVLLYKQMAGQIGDVTIPAENKMAAMQVIEEINRRYLNQVQAKKVPSVAELPKKAAPAQAYADAEKERRYQEFKRSQGK
jgi:hypothetical protein